MTTTDERIATVLDFIHTSIGTWPMDKYDEEIPTSIRLGAFSWRDFTLVSAFEEKYVVKMFAYILGGSQSPPDSDSMARKYEHELKIMKLAEGCSVQPIGRIFDNAGNLRGFIMPLETSLVPPRPITELPLFPSERHSMASRKQIIYQLSALVSLLHSKGVIHGDIKPTNLLQCSDGQLRFCDFEHAGIIGQNPKSKGLTTNYSSPIRQRDETSDSPLSVADDFYATGISIWEIYTGCMPFGDLQDFVFLEDIVAAGVRPDLSKIDDPEIMDLASSYLDRGCSGHSGTIRQTREVCIGTTIVFNGCLANPPHTFSHLVRCVTCSANPPPDRICPNLYQAPGFSKSTEVPSCTLCPESNT